MKTAAIFSDNMVLQRGMNVRVFGSCSGGEKSISVRIPELNISAEASICDDRWEAVLPALPQYDSCTLEVCSGAIKKIFRNSRIIGRRFRLVHVFFGTKIFEVSTFRSIADGSVGNSFGDIDEDVMRRDFTLNALYYDPLKEHVIDYVGGVQDIRKKILRPVIPMNRIFTRISWIRFGILKTGQPRSFDRSRKMIIKKKVDKMLWHFVHLLFYVCFQVLRYFPGGIPTNLLKTDWE